MSSLKFFVTAGFGKYAAEKLNYSQAVRIGNTIHIAGQGGWYPDSVPNISFPTTLKDEIEQAFKNVEQTIQAAGGRGWADVYKVHSYHARWDGDSQSNVPNAHTEAMVEMFAKYGQGRKPVWTEIGVARLGLLRMRIEIEIEALIEEQS